MYFPCSALFIYVLNSPLYNNNGFEQGGFDNDDNSGFADLIDNRTCYCYHCICYTKINDVTKL